MHMGEDVHLCSKAEATHTHTHTATIPSEKPFSCLKICYKLSGEQQRCKLDTTQMPLSDRPERGPSCASHAQRESTLQLRPVGHIRSFTYVRARERGAPARVCSALLRCHRVSHSGLGLPR